LHAIAFRARALSAAGRLLHRLHSVACLLAGQWASIVKKTRIGSRDVGCWWMRDNDRERADTPAWDGIQSVDRTGGDDMHPIHECMRLCMAVDVLAARRPGRRRNGSTHAAAHAGIRPEKKAIETKKRSCLTTDTTSLQAGRHQIVRWRAADRSTTSSTTRVISLSRDACMAGWARLLCE
jgi:hypothetical protein